MTARRTIPLTSPPSNFGLPHSPARTHSPSLPCPALPCPVLHSFHVRLSWLASDFSYFSHLHLLQLRIVDTLRGESQFASICSLYRETNSLVEEFMLLANISVAQKIYAEFRECALLRRHPPPPQSNFAQLQRAILPLVFFLLLHLHVLRALSILLL